MDVSENSVETYTGRFVDVADPDPESINLEDIAHALAQTCRYGGHSRIYYSVAAHAVFVSQRIERRGHGNGLQLAALHHDDSEAYLGDIPRPIKPLLRDYEVLTERMDHAICKALGQSSVSHEAFHDPALKLADNWALLVEARYLLPSEGRHWYDTEQGLYLREVEDLPSRIVVPDYWHGYLSPKHAKNLYLRRHAELIERIEH